MMISEQRLERMWNIVAMAKLKHLPGGTGEIHENPVRIVSWLRFKPSTSRMQILCVTIIQTFSIVTLLTAIREALGYNLS